MWTKLHQKSHSKVFQQQFVSCSTDCVRFENKANVFEAQRKFLHRCATHDTRAFYFYLVFPWVTEHWPTYQTLTIDLTEILSIINYKESSISSTTKTLQGCNVFILKGQTSKRMQALKLQYKYFPWRVTALKHYHSFCLTLSAPPLRADRDASWAAARWMEAWSLPGTGCTDQPTLLACGPTSWSTSPHQGSLPNATNTAQVGGDQSRRISNMLLFSKLVLHIDKHIKVADFPPHMMVLPPNCCPRVVHWTECHLALHECTT